LLTADSCLYRRDCSGYVDMAWHTSTDNWTGNMDEISFEISRSELKAGDILNDAAQHVFLFHEWESDHVHFSYYTFGSTPVRHVTHVSIDDATFDGHPNGEYIARRYNKLIDGGVRVPSDFNGGGRTDMAAFRPSKPSVSWADCLDVARSDPLLRLSRACEGVTGFVELR
jgi:hypothetical protein